MFHSKQYSIILYRTLQYSTVQYSTASYNAIHCVIVQHNTMQYNTAPYNTEQCTNVPHNTIQNNTAHCNIIQYGTVPHNTLQYNTAPNPRRTKPRTQNNSLKSPGLSSITRETIHPNPKPSGPNLFPDRKTLQIHCSCVQNLQS